MRLQEMLKPREKAVSCVYPPRGMKVLNAQIVASSSYFLTRIGLTGLNNRSHKSLLFPVPSFPSFFANSIGHLQTFHGWSITMIIISIMNMQINRFMKQCVSYMWYRGWSVIWRKIGQTLILINCIVSGVGVLVGGFFICVFFKFFCFLKLAF